MTQPHSTKHRAWHAADRKGRVGGWVGKRMNGLIDRQMNGWEDGWMCTWVDGQVGRQMHG